MDKFSIICPFRDRKEVVEDFIYHFSSLYPRAEIIMVQQANKKKFRRGQLLNAGFKYASTCDVNVFVDVDLRLIEKIDFVGLSNKFQSPYYPYYTIKQARILQKGKYRITGREWKNCNGGMYVFTREQFLKINGHSNLYIGHSYEDTDLRQRTDLAREQNTILHISHPSISNKDDIKANKYIFDQRSRFDIQKDGVNQLVCRYEIKEIENKIKRLDVFDIKVEEGFEYFSLIKERYEQ